MQGGLETIAEGELMRDLMLDKPSPTDEQAHILRLVGETDDNLMINALAGTGKTATLEMIEALGKRIPQPVLYLVFNKKNATDAEKRMASTTTVRTFNSLGHRIWAKATKQFKPDGKKIPDLLRSIINETKSRDTQRKLWESFWAICEGVNKARGIGYIPDGHTMERKRLCGEDDLAEALDEAPDDFTLQWINSLLSKSIALAYDGLCDFNDQIYMPTLFGGAFPEFPLVMVDEYQDLNPINHRMVEKLVRHRLIGVGDPYQSIYEFRGAVSAGMREATIKHSMSTCDLSISFRCPEAIVRSVHWRVPKFRWAKSGGSVRVLDKLLIVDIPKEATFICRNNAPLFKLAMKLLSNGRSVSVSGSDIGPKLIAQMKKLGDLSMTQSQCISAIDSWLESRLEKGSKSAQDSADCMRVFMDHGDTLGQAIAYAQHLFAQTGSITLVTGHKAKGLEWSTVFILDSWLLGDTEQDRNLAYVMATRSADRLYYINSAEVRI